MNFLFALLVSLPLPGNGVVPVEATRVDENTIVVEAEAGPGGHFSNVEIKMHGELTSKVTQAGESKWIVKTFRDLGVFTGILCDADSCTPVREVFQYEPTGVGERIADVVVLLPFALLAGFLLNFMPCVLPVLGLKLRCFTKGDGRGAYVAGVVLSFWVLATFAVLTGAGLSHMSIPAFRLLLVVCCSIMAAKLFGFWELPQTGLIGNYASRGGPFLTGCLTVALGSSCSVPFLAPILLFISQCPALEVYLLFTAMGVGFCGPFLLPLARFIPKSGRWTLYFENACGAAMAAVAAWIASTLGPDQLGYALISSSFGIFCLVFWTRKDWAIAKVFAGLFAAAIVLMIFMPSSGGNLPARPVGQFKPLEGPRACVFTADWCVNCKYVEPLWHDEQVMQAMVSHGIVLETFDWTDGASHVTQILDHYHHQSVPFAVLVNKDGKTETLSGIYTKGDILGLIDSLFTTQ